MIAPNSNVGRSIGGEPRQAPQSSDSAHTGEAISDRRGSQDKEAHSKIPEQRTVRRRAQRLLAYFTLPSTPGRKSEIVFIQGRSSKTDSQINSLRSAILDNLTAKSGIASLWSQ